MDEKRKSSSKKDTGSSSTRSLFSRSTSTSNSPLLRSLSQKSSSSSSKCNNNNLPRSFSQKNPSIGRKCTKLAKEQKARFYIMRRCVAMLVCWHKHGDSWKKCTDLVLSFYWFMILLLAHFEYYRFDCNYELTKVSYKIYTLLEICIWSIGLQINVPLLRLILSLTPKL